MTRIPPIKRSNAQASAYYDRISAIYDILAASERKLIQQGVDLLEVQPGEDILEIGCGTGRTLKYAAGTLSDASALVGLDLSRQMLLQSRRKTSQAIPTACLIQADGAHLPLLNGHFDVVFAAFTLELFSIADMGHLLGECRRVLTPTGRLGIVSLVGSPRNLAVRLYELAHRLFPVAVDCRPIPLAELLTENGFHIHKLEQASMWGLPVHLTLSTIRSRTGAVSR